MILRNNLPASNALRNAGVNKGKVAKNLERLSSGFRINRASDDASGLAVSEKMRAMICALDRGMQNISEGIDLTQAADGGLNEIHAILQRMGELAFQSSNGIYQDEDRSLINQEYQVLKDEIDRIAESTNYNGISLLSVPKFQYELEKVSEGDMPLMLYSLYESENPLESYASILKNATFTADDNQSCQTYYFSDGSGNYEEVYFNIERYILEEDGTAEYPYKSFQDFLRQDLYDVDGTVDPDNAEYFAKRIASAMERGFLEKGYDFKVRGSITPEGRISFEFTDPPGAGLNMGGCSAIPDNGFGHYFMHMELNVGGTPIDSGMTVHYEDWDLVEKTTDVWIKSGLGTEDGLYIALCDVQTSALGIDKTAVSSIEESQEAIEFLDEARGLVSQYRSSFGAKKNRLETTARSNGVTAENLQASESAICDLDMAREMAEFVKNNILTQAAQAMMAQANQLPQHIIELLR